jgi:ketosteroid isomerase-like protein
MPEPDARTVATECLQAWTTGDLDRTRALLHPDVTFVGPLASTQGVDDYMTGIDRMTAIVSRAEQTQVVAEGDDVCIAYDLITNDPPATIPTVGWYRVQDGKVVSVRAYFDPRPLLEGAA